MPGIIRMFHEKTRPDCLSILPLRRSEIAITDIGGRRSGVRKLIKKYCTKTWRIIIFSSVLAKAANWPLLLFRTANIYLHPVPPRVVGALMVKLLP
jgi:hypothetical protein